MNTLIGGRKYLAVACAFALLFISDACAKDEKIKDVKPDIKKEVIVTVGLTLDGRLILSDSSGKTSDEVKPTKIADIVSLLKDVGAITGLSNVMFLETKSSPRRLKICIDGMCYCFEINEQNGTTQLVNCQ